MKHLLNGLQIISALFAFGVVIGVAASTYGSTDASITTAPDGCTSTTCGTSFWFEFKPVKAAA